MRALVLLVLVSGCASVDHAAMECQERPTRWVEEPPVVDEWYVWKFDGTWWDDELDGFVVRYSSACSTID